MICVNELSQQKCHNLGILRTLVTLMAPFAPHIAEELWHALGEAKSVCDALWPEWKEEYLTEDSMKLSISFNGKLVSHWISLQMQTMLPLKRRY